MSNHYEAVTLCEDHSNTGSSLFSVSLICMLMNSKAKAKKKKNWLIYKLTLTIQNSITDHADFFA